ncbi:MAG: hypothetical protein H6573_30875 [Lewinellaceae bacterium]|nr:hypothetical protein [Phaeodactylibacter sp.]MCB9351864.1 hypothetical protein [Lewinellaceae bacterium]
MTTYRNNLLAPAAFLLLFILASCASPQHLVESGNYDEAVYLAVKRLSGKKNKKEKYVLALEEAFEKATERDMRLAERLKREGRPENWAKVNEAYRRVRNRQERVAPLLPLISKEGIRANFKFVKVDELEYESRQKAADYYYARAQDWLEDARQGDKLAARRAYDELDKINQYFREYKDKTALKQTARQLGTTHVLVKLENRSRSILPVALEREIRRIGVRDLNSFWQAYYTEQTKGVDYDYEVVMKVTNLEVGPQVVKEREFEEVKEIEEGFDYVLDSRGNVLKDSLGNDVKVPRKVLIRARVFETFQTKVASIDGRLEFYDARNGNLIDSKPLAADAVFENYASTFRGDKRALSEEACRYLGNRPQPFPSDEALLLTAMERLKPVIKNRIAETRKLI